MLPRSSQTNRTSTIPAPESIHPLQEYLADVQSKSGKDFPDINDEGAEENEEHHSSSQITADRGKDELAGFQQLITNKDFSVLFRQFFVVGHKELVILKSKILLDRKESSNALIKPSDVNAHNIEALREKLYNLQMAFFNNPKGRQYDIAH